ERIGLRPIEQDAETVTKLARRPAHHRKTLRMMRAIEACRRAQLARSDGFRGEERLILAGEAAQSTLRARRHRQEPRSKRVVRCLSRVRAGSFLQHDVDVGAAER